MIFEPLNFALGYCDLDELKAIYSYEIISDATDPLNESTFNNKNFEYYSIDQFDEATPQLSKNFNLFHKKQCV